MATSGVDRPDLDPLADVEEEMSRLPWWLFLVFGVAWLTFAFIVLSFDFRTVWAIAIFAGVSFLFAAANELATAMSVRDWRWLHAVLSALCTGAAIVALLWPNITFIVLAAVIAWFLLFQGAVDVIGSLMYRHDFWWARLVAGLVEIALAVWAITYPRVSFVLLAAWVGGAAILRGIGQIILALAIRDTSNRRVHGNAGAQAERSSTPYDDRDGSVIEEFRRNGGRVGGNFEGQPMLLLHTTDRTSGRQHVTPLMYQAAGESIVVFAANARRPAKPEWYSHLMADPHATIEIGDEEIAVDARVAGPAERERVWRPVVGAPGADDSERQSDRSVPAIVLERSRRPLRSHVR